MTRIIFTLLVLLFVNSCKVDDHVQYNLDRDEKIRNDSLFTEWQTSKSPYWFGFLLSKIDKNKVTRTNALEVIHSVARVVKTTQEHYERQLFEKYGGADKSQFRTHLESLIKSENIPQYSAKTIRSALRTQYRKFTTSTISKGLVMSNAIPEVVIVYCGIPSDLLSFYTTYVGLGYPLSASNQEQLSCMETSLAQLATVISSLISDGNISLEF